MTETPDDRSEQTSAPTSTPAERLALARAAKAEKRASAADDTRDPAAVLEADRAHKAGVLEGAKEAERQRLINEGRAQAKAEFDASMKAATDRQLLPGHVWVRVLPLGHDKLSTGAYDPSTNSFPHYPKGAVLQCLEGSAKQHETAGRVEILDDV